MTPSRLSKVRPHATWTTLHSSSRAPKSQRSTKIYVVSKTDQSRVFVGPLARTSLHQRKLKLLGQLAFAARFIPSEHPLTSSRPSLLAFRPPAWREGSYTLATKSPDGVSSRCGVRYATEGARIDRDQYTTSNRHHGLTYPRKYHGIFASS